VSLLGALHILLGASHNKRRQADQISARSSLQFARCAGRYEKDMNQPSGLISVLLDPSADDASRDDAAMDLSEFDQAEEALFKAALLPGISDIVRASCGESLAEIWLRAGAVNRKYYDALPPTAQIAARNYIYSKNSDLLKS